MINDAGMVIYERIDTSTGTTVSINAGPDPFTATLLDTGGPFRAFGEVCLNDQGVMAFYANPDAGGYGYFAWDGASTTKIVDNTDFLGVGGGGCSINDQGTLAFTAFLGAGYGVFTSDGQSITTVDDNVAQFPFRAFPSINAAGTVAFLAGPSQGTSNAVFSGPNPLVRVVGPGDPLFGSTVESVDFSVRGLNESGQIAFFARLADGSQGIFRAEPNQQPVVRSAPYDLSDDCNAISSFGDGEAKAQSKADTGGLIVDAKTTKVGNARSQAGVGINYVAELTGDAKIEAIVRLGIRPTTFDIVCGLSLPKVGKFSIASVESDAFVRATNGAAQEATERFRAAITTPLPGGSLSPCDLMRYNPPVLLRVSLDASLVQGKSYQICAGIRSKVVSVSPFKLLAIAKALYVAEVVQMKVAYK